MTTSGTDEDERPGLAVDRVLAARVATLRDQVRAITPEAEPLVDALARMLDGGKRLRAAFTYWGWRVHGGQPGTVSTNTASEGTVARVGAAHELFQASALIHDDVMDDSDTRRGHPAVHRTFAVRHTDLGLTGDRRRFGEASAILLGNLAHVACDAELAAALRDLPQARADAVRGVFDLMRTEVNAGQYLDMLAQAQPPGVDAGEVDEARARQVIRAKSARYSVEHPLVIGALLAGADAAQVAVCRAVGLPLGEAFQLRDDLLGVLGDPSVTGKPAGDDLREGKRTVLVVRALARAREAGDEATVALLTAVLGDRDASDEVVARATAAIRATGAVAEVEALIADLSAEAFALLDAQPWPEPEATRLRTLARAAVERHA
ncbi:MAG: polyprenyl synthetase family protein [Micrococcales bacterium]|nr:polyprenyl synthetase family protein [Micrococcales bacterium]